MLLRSYKTLLQTQKSLINPFITPSLIRPFCSWRPDVPKFEIRDDDTGYTMAHPLWDLVAANKVNITHFAPQDRRDKLALNLVRLLRKVFDGLSGYNPDRPDTRVFMNRFIFLETVAAVPGMIAAMVRHMRSIKNMTKDLGWIHHLLEEAENERMHLFTFLEMKKPGRIFRLFILGGQFVFIMAFTSLYICSSKTAHRFTGYLEEEAVITYSNCIKEIDEGRIPQWEKEGAPEIAKSYWGLKADSTFRDVLIAIRADEAMHREMNHHFATMKPNERMDTLAHIIKEQAENSGGSEKVSKGSA